MLTDVQACDDTRFREICREHSWKCTAQRRAVFGCLCGNHEHPSVETVWRAVRTTLPDVSLDSIYRILDDFAGAGLIQRLESPKIMRYDANTDPHDHFICSECGRMFDFSFLEAERVAGVCQAFGDVSAVELNVHGVCKACRKKEE